MNQRWSLDELYKSFESEKFKKDYEKCCKEIEEIKDWTEDNLKDSNDAAHKMRKYVKSLNKFYMLYTRLYFFAQLTLSVEAKNEKALKEGFEAGWPAATLFSEFWILRGYRYR